MLLFQNCISYCPDPYWKSSKPLAEIVYGTLSCFYVLPKLSWSLFIGSSFWFWHSLKWRNYESDRFTPAVSSRWICSWLLCLRHCHAGDFCHFLLLTCFLSGSFQCCGGRKPVSMCGWQVWGENCMQGLRLQETVVCVAPLELRGMQNEALSSNFLTLYSLEKKDSRKHRCVVYRADGFLYSLFL